MCCCHYYSKQNNNNYCISCQEDIKKKKYNTRNITQMTNFMLKCCRVIFLALKIQCSWLQWVNEYPLKRNIRIEKRIHICSFFSETEVLFSLVYACLMTCSIHCKKKVALINKIFHTFLKYGQKTLNYRKKSLQEKRKKTYF